MGKTRPPAIEAPPQPPPLPGWIVTAGARTLDVAAFRSGAALAHLALLMAEARVPQALWRERLALAAAETCTGLAGRSAGARTLRDAMHLARATDDPGPAGRVLRQWTRAAARPLTVAGLAGAVEGIAAGQIARCLDMQGATPVDRAARVIETVLSDTPHAETEALILADAVLAAALGRDRLLPLLGLAASRGDLARAGDALRLACHRAVVRGAGLAVPLAAELSRAAVRLRAVTPQLRARGAARAVELFLTRDALAPGALDFMSDRAARRLCDRLVALGGLRELTGRDSFRLYGI